MKKCLSFFFFITINILYPNYYSQCGQDEFMNNLIFRNKKNGVFIDIGAHDGKTYSNSLYFEKELGWTGICVEPMPNRFLELSQNRKCICVQGCISDFNGKSTLLMVSSPRVNTEMLSGLLHKYDPRHKERVLEEINLHGGSFETLDVDCYLLNDLLEKHKFYHIDMLSVDTEGGEFDILASIDFNKYKIDVITVEDNYEDHRFYSFLGNKGYKFIKRLGCDLVFIRTTRN